MIEARGLAKRCGRPVAVDQLSFDGDPGVLLFDEPANGLHPEGIRWIRSDA